MKKQGILFFVLRALARQLQRQANFLFRLIEEVERPAPRALPVAHDPTRTTKQDLSDAEVASPPSDWQEGEPPAHWLRRVEQAMPALLADRDADHRSYVLPAMPALSDLRETERTADRQVVALLRESASPSLAQRADMSRPLLAKSTAKSVEEVPHHKHIPAREEAAPTPLSLARPRLSVQPKTRLYAIEEQRSFSPSQQSQEVSAPLMNARPLPERSNTARVHVGPTQIPQAQMMEARSHTPDNERGQGNTAPYMGRELPEALAMEARLYPFDVKRQSNMSRHREEPERYTRPQTNWPDLPIEQDPSPDATQQAAPAAQPANHVSWSGLDSLSSIQPSRTTDGTEQRTQEETGWPALPDETYGNTRPWRAVYQVWERQQRLDSEQRGEIWNA